MKRERVYRRDDRAVAEVIATLLMVAITVVLAAVLYVMVQGLLTNPTSLGTLGVNVSRSSEGTNWTLTATITPTSASLSHTALVIKGGTGDVVLSSAPLIDYLTPTNGVKYVQVSSGAPNVEVGDTILIDATRYPLGHRFDITGSSSILATGELK